MVFVEIKQSFATKRNKALAKTLFHFFSALGFSAVAKKMKVCFVRWHKLFCGWAFLLFFFVRLPFKAVSVVNQSNPKNCSFKAVKFEVGRVLIKLQITHKELEK